MNAKNHTLRSILALFGAFCIAYNLACLTHELGHALAVTIGGGAAERITLNPFSYSYTHYADVGRSRMFASAGGVLFGTPAGLFAWLFTRRSKTFFLLPLRLCGAISFSVNGIYLLADPLLGMNGDASSLLRLGLPPWVVMSTAGGLILAGLLLATQTQPALGIRPGHSFIGRLGILWGGILPYLGLVAVYNALHPAQPGPLVWGLVAAGGGLAALVWAVFGWAVHEAFGWPQEPAAEPGWSHALGLLAAGVLVLYLIRAYPVWYF